MWRELGCVFKREAWPFFVSLAVIFILAWIGV